MIKKIPSPNFDQRQGAVDMLVLHYTGRLTLEESLAWLTDPEKKVSAHYLIGEQGEVIQLVPEAMRAWHAGVSYWKGESDINSCSIGIELQNPGHEFGYKDFPEAQIAALIGLSKDIISRHSIPQERILGHSDVAPTRKQDPGELFPWKKLAEEGIGLWPQGLKDVSGLSEKRLRDYFTRFGYAPEGNLQDIITAFQRHWRPDNISGAADEETLARLLVLL